MDWADWAVWLLLAAIIVILYQLVRLMREQKQQRQLAEDAEQSRKQAEAEQQRNRQLKQEMTSNIAHELKTPISSIRGYLEILLGDKPIDEEKRRFFIERCYRQTLRLSDLIQDVSTINKIEESSALFPLERMNIYDIVQEASIDLEDNAKSLNITIINSLPENMIVNGNHELLFRIFRNLIENSVTYAGENARIVIETYKPKSTDVKQSHCFIHYYDTGKGVADEYLPLLFDRFQRADEGRSRSRGGTGLGLSIVKHAILFHDGEIYAKNRQEGGLEYFFSIKK